MGNEFSLNNFNSMLCIQDVWVQFPVWRQTILSFGVFPQSLIADAEKIF
jgi:hypothetical protein